MGKWDLIMSVTVSVHFYVIHDFGLSFESTIVSLSVFILD